MKAKGKFSDLIFHIKSIFKVNYFIEFKEIELVIHCSFWKVCKNVSYLLVFRKILV
jgi:hypothetical protein